MLPALLLVAIIRARQLPCRTKLPAQREPLIMKLTKILLAVALPLALSAGCAMDVGTDSNGLVKEENSNFATNVCGQSIQHWLGDAPWPVDTIVAGDMEFTKGELIDYTQQNPGARTDLISEIAAAQLNMTVALVIPDGLVDDLVAADDLLMADEDGGTPPPVNIDDFGDLTDFNDPSSVECFEAGNQVAQEVIPTGDRRDDLVFETGERPDLRTNLLSRD